MLSGNVAGAVFARGSRVNDASTPEINYDKIDKIKGLNISIVTTARTDEEGRALLRYLGMPFRS